MTLLANTILGHESEPRFAGRVRERLPVASYDAAKRRLRGRTDAGTDVAVDLPRGSYLRHGAVIADDGRRVVVVDRVPEQALVVRLAAGLPREALIEAAARIGHALGNRHVPLEVAGGELRAPITTSPELAVASVRALGLPGVEARVELVRLAADRPPAAAQAH